MQRHPASHSLPPATQRKLSEFFQLGADHGCPRDQLLNFSRAGLILQPRQLAASAAAGILPSLFIHERCRQLLACLPQLQHDPDRPGDVLKTNLNEDGVGGDDLGDCLRYLVATRPREIVVRKLLA